MAVHPEQKKMQQSSTQAEAPKSIAREKGNVVQLKLSQ